MQEPRKKTSAFSTDSGYTVAFQYARRCHYENRSSAPMIGISSGPSPLASLFSASSFSCRAFFSLSSFASRCATCVGMRKASQKSAQESAVEVVQVGRGVSSCTHPTLLRDVFDVCLLLMEALHSGRTASFLTFLLLFLLGFRFSSTVFVITVLTPVAVRLL